MTTWNFGSTSPPVMLAVSADGGTFAGAFNQFAVSGTFTPAGPGQPCGALALHGGDDLVARTFVAAAGVLYGPGAAPTQIVLWVTESSGGTGTLNGYQATLTPRS
jgi:hypothetical protein